MVFAVRPNDLMNLVAGDIGSLAQVWIAHHVEIGEAGQTERLAQAAALGGFEIEDQDRCCSGWSACGAQAV